MEFASFFGSDENDSMEGNNTPGGSSSAYQSPTSKNEGSQRTFSDDLICGLPFVQDVMDTLQCPTCLEVPIPPIHIYTCTVGHTVCATCKTKLDKCALCRKPLTDKRSFFAESLLNSCLFKCNYERYGCCEIVKGSEHEGHIKICRHRPLLCWQKDNEKCAGTPVQLNLYLNHLKEKHLVTGSIITDDTPEIVIINWSMKNNPILYSGKQTWIQYIVYNSKEFLLDITIKKRVLTAWVTLLENDDEFKRYKATFQIATPTFPYHNKCIWVFQTQSVHTTSENILESGQCATMLAAALKPYLESSGPFYKLKFAVKLERLNAEQKVDVKL